MRCLDCGLAALTEQPERTAQGYRRFRCRECGKQFNERSAGVLNRTHYRSDTVADFELKHLDVRSRLIEEAKALDNPMVEIDEFGLVRRRCKNAVFRQQM